MYCVNSSNVVGTMYVFNWNPTNMAISGYGCKVVNEVMKYTLAIFGAYIAT